VSKFDLAMQRLLKTEGGYVEDPLDPGGETRFGISKRAYPDVDIASLTPEGAVAIYRRDFWDPIHGDELPFPIADQLLDFAVNAGVQTSIRKGQEAAGVADDGHWGPVTQAAISSVPTGIFMLRFAALKIRYYTRLTTFPRFGAGWLNRIAQDLDYAAEDMGGG
jgi:lysozyme family protein